MMKRWLAVFLIAGMGVYQVHAQMRRVTGMVTAAGKGTPVAGASVVVKGTHRGTLTNQNGYYELDISYQAQSLVFSYVGMKTAELPVEDSVVNAVLEADVMGLEEVVVVAYGAAPRQQFTGSLSTLDAAELERFQSADFSSTMQGMLSGVYTAGGSGQPGTGDAIRIRGISTFGDAAPLIVLDGFPFDGAMNSIPLSEIESLTVLKDASSTALYGSRAANGVVVLTTKKGPTARPGLTLQMSYGIAGRGIPDYDKVSVPQYYELQWERVRNSLMSSGLSPGEAGQQASRQLVALLGGYNAYNVPDDELVGSNGRLNPDARLLWRDNWQDELINAGKRREISLTAQGGTLNSSYLLTGSFLDQEGIIKASDFKRYAIRANVNSRLTSFITAGVNLSGALSEQNYPESAGPSLLNPFRFTGFIAPIYPVYLYDQSGRVQTDTKGEKLFDYGTGYGRARPFGSNLNVLGTIALDERRYKNDVFTLRSFLDFELATGVSFKASLSADYSNFSGLTHKNMRYGDGRSFNGRSTRDTHRALSYTANQMLNFSRKLADHDVQLLASHENYSYTYNLLEASRSGFPFPGLVELDGAAVGEGSGSYEDNYRLESYLGKINYAFKNRYFASFNFRTDGNSRFAESVRWGNFWGAGLAWLLSEEAFLSPVNWINLLKLKISYGEQGNDKIGSFYGYQGLYQTGMNNLEYPGLIASRLSTPGLTWESLNAWDMGTELTLNSRFSLNFNYYIRQNNDLLFAQPLAPSTGFTFVDANIARLTNTGYDLEITGRLLDAENFKWKLETNLGHFNNEIKELPQDAIISGNMRWEEGRSIYDFWIEEFAGVDPETGKSQWFYDVPVIDADNEPVLDEEGHPVYEEERGLTTDHNRAGRYYAGSSLPDLSGGINNTFSFLGFDLSVLMAFSVGGKVYDHLYQMLMHSGMEGYHLHADVLERWTPENKNTKVPVLDGDPNANWRSTRFLAGADYLSLRNAVLAYEIPDSFTSRFNMASVRLSLKADNLWMTSARKGLNPGQSFDGYVQPQYIPVRTVSVGCDIHF